MQDRQAIEDAEVFDEIFNEHQEAFINPTEETASCKRPSDATEEPVAKRLRLNTRASVSPTEVIPTSSPSPERDIKSSTSVIKKVLTSPLADAVVTPKSSPVSAEKKALLEQLKLRAAELERENKTKSTAKSPIKKNGSKDPSELLDDEAKSYAREFSRTSAENFLRLADKIEKSLKANASSLTKETYCFLLHLLARIYFVSEDKDRLKKAEEKNKECLKINPDYKEAKLFKERYFSKQSNTFRCS